MGARCQHIARFPCSRRCSDVHISGPMGPRFPTMSTGAFLACNGRHRECFQGDLCSFWFFWRAGRGSTHCGVNQPSFRGDGKAEQLRGSRVASRAGLVPIDRHYSPTGVIPALDLLIEPAMHRLQKGLRCAAARRGLILLHKCPLPMSMQHSSYAGA